jgi:alpha-amylase
LTVFSSRLWLSGYAEDKDLVKHIKVLNVARKAAITANSQFLSTPVRPGYFLDSLGTDCGRVKMSFPVASQTTLAVSKPPMLALFTNVGTSGSASWNIAKSGYSGNTRLIDVLSCTVVTTNSDGGLTANTTNGLPQVYVPVSALPASSKVCTNNVTTGNSASRGVMPSMVLAGLSGFVYLLTEVGF